MTIRIASRPAYVTRADGSRARHVTWRILCRWCGLSQNLTARPTGKEAQRFSAAHALITCPTNLRRYF